MYALKISEGVYTYMEKLNEKGCNILIYTKIHHSQERKESIRRKSRRDNLTVRIPGIENI